MIVPCKLLFILPLSLALCHPPAVGVPCALAPRLADGPCAPEAALITVRRYGRTVRCWSTYKYTSTRSKGSTCLSHSGNSGLTLTAVPSSAAVIASPCVSRPLCLTLLQVNSCPVLPVSCPEAQVPYHSLLRRR